MLYTLPPEMVRRADTQELRDNFLLAGLFAQGEIKLRVCELDRVVVGGVVPTSGALELPALKELACEYFCERRELGVINLGGEGDVTVDGETFSIGHCDAVYVSRGSKKVTFASKDNAKPAQFYLVSYPAHKEYPTKLVRHADVEPRVLGQKTTANCRKLYQLIVPGRADSCQLVMGFTKIEDGSVWNTMPPHTHLRRSEVYCYFDVSEGALVFHFMGEPTETRHLVMREKDAVLSPAWSIHSGAGTGPYSFVWAMGGENQSFDDMDHCDLSTLR
ncbi:MAG: 5-dehydro-4-deoxy-D-glucuronate isomerase [Verrucomicrobiota bacterium JB022]|nr:5-dehydro-4-deoxy-D-glucuronate isomerase [Verrucomicrobiota bacterium JB022]